LKAEIKAVAAVIGCLLAAVAGGEESQVRLKGGPDADRVRAHCSSCHSVDYVEMNSPFLKRAAWEAEVRKMIKVMGAPIPEAEVAPLVDYLTRNYGVE
jgi:sulfite dehydrogenase (cytochrome) subunit B